MAESAASGNSTAYLPQKNSGGVAGVNVNYYKMFPPKREEDEGSQASSVEETPTRSALPAARDLGTLVQQQQTAWQQAEQELSDLRKSSAAQASQRRWRPSLRPW